LSPGLVVYGGSAADDVSHALGWNDAIGMGIGGISMLGMAVFYVYVQKTGEASVFKIMQSNQSVGL
jgi:hypothetical protein